MTILPAYKPTTLIFAPHPDDETLACGGLISASVNRGEKVRVVFLTNGDGHGEAASFLLKKNIADLDEADFDRLGLVRKAEAVKAASFLGLGKSDLMFLGYPDGRLSRLYRNESRQFVTGEPAVPGSIIARLVQIIKDTNPDRIYVPAEFDAHPDHRACFWFVRDAIKYSGYLQNIFIYVVHAGDDSRWPFPRGATPLLPIEQINHLGQTLPVDAPWPPSHRHAMNSAAVDAKCGALACYESQFIGEADREYYESFIKCEEIFWQIDPRYYPGW